MGVEIPNDFDVDLTGIPSTLHLNVDTLPSVHFNVDTLPSIHFNVDALPVLHLAVDSLPKIQFAVDPVEIRLTEFPSVRGHLPADFCIGLSILGLEVMNIRLCGEAQVITEPYRPNPCEICGPTSFIQISRSDPGTPE
ncbi:MAG TPA: hypothetical protein VF179_24130 [Thermoanaerobaculia bacterium]|nr:hypothetical protein [Thermoanaerobaculia bacterium]